jgi:hypothetical protein
MLLLVLNPLLCAVQIQYRDAQTPLLAIINASKPAQPLKAHSKPTL